MRKIDVLSKTCRIWYEDGCYASEPIFLRNPSDETVETLDQFNQIISLRIFQGDEDAGVLIISLLRSGEEEEVSLVIIDAKNLIEIGRVQFKTNSPVPKCLHGLWVDSRLQ